jgi:hypothetical protein
MSVVAIVLLLRNDIKVIVSIDLSTWTLIMPSMETVVVKSKKSD